MWVVRLELASVRLVGYTSKETEKSKRGKTFLWCFDIFLGFREKRAMEPTGNEKGAPAL